MRGTVKDTLGLVNHDIVFGDVVVSPGELVDGDDDGIDVAPRGKLEAVLAVTCRRVEKEIEKTSVLKQGVSSVEFNKLDQVFQRLDLVEE